MQTNLNKGKRKTIANRWRKWADALESGDYKQGDGYLKQELGPELRYCCLGVVEDVCGFKGKKYKEENGKITYKFEENDTSLGNKMKKFLQLRSLGDLSDLGVENVKKFTRVTENDSLATLNDGKVKFRTIAKFIRAAAEKLEETGESFFETP